jgi:hypothetical protein
MRTHVCKSKRLRTAVSWTSLPQGLVEHVLTLLPLRVVATAARTCQAWVPAARVVRLRAQLKEALLEPEELIWRRYSGGAERMGREGYDRFLVEVCGCAEEEIMDDEDWSSNVAVCGGTVAEGMDRGGFLHGAYGVCGRDAAADADLLTDQAMLQALLAEAAACPSVRKLSEALEARLAEADLRRPMWTVTTPRLLEILAAQQNDVETVQRCCRQLGQLEYGPDSNQDVVGELGGAEILVATLQAHPYVEAVQGSGCYALGWLVESHPANQAAAVAAGGIEAVVAAMRAHPGAEVAQYQGCDALAYLVCYHPTATAAHPANQTAVAAAGGIEAVVKALRAHPGSEKVQEMGCDALCCLVHDHPVNTATAIAAGAIGLAEATRGRFEAGASEGAHEAGVRLLGSLEQY